MAQFFISFSYAKNHTRQTCKGPSNNNSHFYYPDLCKKDFTAHDVGCIPGNLVHACLLLV